MYERFLKRAKKWLKMPQFLSHILFEKGTKMATLMFCAGILRTESHFSRQQNDYLMQVINEKLSDISI